MSARTQAVLIGGTFMGVLSALPIISAANCCCLWVIGGGVVTAYLLQQGQPGPIDLGEATLMGGLSGVVGAFVFALVSIPVQFVTRPAQEQLVDLLRGNAEVPPEVVEVIEELSSGGVATILFGFVFMLIVGVIFATLGGLIGGLIFRRNRTPDSHAPESSPPAS